MAAFSTIDALDTLCHAIPSWCTRLDDLNGQIAQRQIELARLTDFERPPTARSLRNKGSTESLRPKDETENPLGEKSEDSNDIPLNPFDTPQSKQTAFPVGQHSSSSAVPPNAPTASPTLPTADSDPRPESSALQRQSSQPTPPTQPARAGRVLRKRKTESLASGESMAPKYRTRSMIIVYYDSAVQTAFEELVKFVSGSRNSMRKGKMAAKMAEMKKAAEIELDDEDDETDDDDDGEDESNAFGGPDTLVPGRKADTSALVAGILAAEKVEEADSRESAVATPKLNFMSTKNMGPSRDGMKTSAFPSTLSVGALRGYRRAGSEKPDIFDELDKGLEWCQGQCEHAAHQFLRDGECGTEIKNIKERLGEVKEKAARETERLRGEEGQIPSVKHGPKMADDKRAMQLRGPAQMRIHAGMGTPKDLEGGDMEIDDEGVDDLEPPDLAFRR